MKKKSKRFEAAQQLVEKRVYLVNEALEVIKKTATAKFNESTEAHVCLNLNPKYADQQLRASLVFPAGTGQTIKIAAIVNSETVVNEKLASAAKIGSEALIEEIAQGFLDFDVLIAEPEMMPKLAKVGRILGPRGLMPSPKAGTVTKNIAEAIEEFKKGKVEYRVDKTGIVHINFGKANFNVEELNENLQALYKSILQNKPTGVKGRYFKKMFISTTMGPSIELDLAQF